MTVPILDGHNDTLLNLLQPERGHGRDFFTESEIGHIDLVRARSGGMVGGFFAMFSPAEHPLAVPDEDLTITSDGYYVRLAEPERAEYARTLTASMLALAHHIEQRSDGAVRIVRDSAMLRECLADDVFAMILHIEGAEAIAPDLSNLDDYAAAGVRSLGLVWSRPNAFGHGVPYRFPHTPDTGGGLTREGCELVRACNSRGIMLDLSHLNEQGFWDVAGLSDRPLVATHSNVHTICPVTRNLTDRQLDAIGESGGIVGLAYDVSMIRRDGALEANTPLEMLVDHVDYIAERIGIDHVAFGSDFDGAVMPLDLSDASKLPNLVAALERRGYDEATISKIAYKNWLRVLDVTWID